MKKKRNKKFSKRSKILKKKTKIKKRKKLRKTKNKGIKKQKRKTKRTQKRSLKKQKRKLRKIKRIVPEIKLKKIKLPNFNKQINQFKKLSFRKIVGFIFKPLIKSFGDYRQKKKMEKLKKIENTAKEKEKEIKFREILREELLLLL